MNLALKKPQNLEKQATKNYEAQLGFDWALENGQNSDSKWSRQPQTQNRHELQTNLILNIKRKYFIYIYSKGEKAVAGILIRKLWLKHKHGLPKLLQSSFKFMLALSAILANIK